MRALLLVIGWSSVIGSLADAALWFYAFVIAAQTGWVDLSMSVDAFLKQYLGFLYWVKQVSYYVMPHDFVTWLFGLPALAYFPIRILMSIAIGWWAFTKAGTLVEGRS